MESSRLFFEHLAAEWDARQPADRREKLDQLITAFDAQIKTSTRILEVGTGTGGLLPVLRTHNANALIVQVDFANAMLMCAQSNCNGDHLVQADAHQLPFQTNYFDLVICHNSFPHFKQKPLALHSIYQILQPGSKMLILHEISRERVNAIHQNAAAVEIHQDLLPENDEMYQMLVSTGFTDIQINDSQDRYTVAVKK